MLILISAEPACSALGQGSFLEVLDGLLVGPGHVTGGCGCGFGLVFVGPG